MTEQANSTTSSEYDFDLYVIGGGSGGVRASRIAAGYGARVGLCEESRLGGTCVIRGCVPKKLLMFASQFSESFEDSAGYGWQVGQASFNWSELVAAKEREITRLENVYGQLLGNAGVEMHAGRGVLVDAHTVEVNGQRYSAEKILIAVGGRPAVPDLPGAELGIISDQAFDLPELPKQVLVIGGG
ncbi:MAG: FAD-dependent oxidoreductase, partial [Pseudomonadota bacterium]